MTFKVTWNGTIFLFLTELGIVGNVFVFVNYMYIFFWGTEKKSLHFIHIHLAFTNIILLFSKGMPKTIAAFGLRNFLDDIGCLSICTSSLLTMVQVITISPRASMWGRLKLRSAWHVLPLFLFFWMFNSLITMNLLHSITNSNMNRSQISENDNYCYFLAGRWVIRWIFLTPIVLQDALFQGLTGWASSYMVFLLHQDHKHVLHIRNSKFLVLLMICFVFFYWTDCIISLYLTLSLENNFIISNIQECLALGYATLSPFVLIHRDRHVAECWHVQ
uniref:Vomeronasal type-1 receptor n=1 Tax=Piliocolobus tephrosceles TaxID=591936 RepID=A0A8C9IRN1_9PRIM